MKTSVILALFGFVFAVGFSVALTENELAEIADEYEVKFKFRNTWLYCFCFSCTLIILIFFLFVVQVISF